MDRCRCALLCACEFQHAEMVVSFCMVELLCPMEGEMVLSARGRVG